MARVTNRTDKKDLQPGVKAQTLDKMSRAAQEAAEGGEKRTHEDRLDPMRDQVPGHLGYTKANLENVIAPGPNPVSKSNIGLEEQQASTPARREAPVQVRNAAPKKAAMKKPTMKAAGKKSGKPSKASKKSASSRASTASKTASKKRKPTMRAQQSKTSASKSASGMISKAVKTVRGAAKKIADGVSKTSGTRTGRKVTASAKAGRKTTAARSASGSASTRSRRTTGSRRTTMH